MNASKTAVFSMGTVFSLSATVFQQPIAEISHVVGRKPAYLLVLGVFAIGSIVAAMAKDMTGLLIGRSMQGFASGGSVLAALVLTDLIELRDRATWLSVQNATQAIGLICGPLVGASILKAASWVGILAIVCWRMGGTLTNEQRWLFWINLPAITASAAGLGILLGFDRPEAGVLQSLKKVDWVGIAIFMPSAVALLVPFTMSGIFFPWGSWQSILPLIVGISGLAALATHQRYFAKNPMFKSVLFTEWATVCSFLGQAVFGVCVNMIFYYLVVFWSGVRGFDEIMTGVALLPETFSIPVAAILCGLGMRKTGQIRRAMCVGWPLISISIGLLWFLDAHTPLPTLVVINAGVGLGAGVVVSSLNVAILATTKKEDNGHAMAMGFLFKSAGMCLGIAIGTAVFTVQMDNQLSTLGGEAEMTAESFLRALRQVKNDPAGQEVIVRALRILWIICSGLSGIVGFLCCLCQYPTQWAARVQDEGSEKRHDSIESTSHSEWSKNRDKADVVSQGHA